MGEQGSVLAGVFLGVSVAVELKRALRADLGDAKKNEGVLAEAYSSHQAGNPKGMDVSNAEIVEAGRLADSGTHARRRIPKWTFIAQTDLKTAADPEF